MRAQGCVGQLQSGGAIASRGCWRATFDCLRLVRYDIRSPRAAWGEPRAACEWAFPKGRPRPVAAGGGGMQARAAGGGWLANARARPGSGLRWSAASWSKEAEGEVEGEGGSEGELEGERTLLSRKTRCLW